MCYSCSSSILLNADGIELGSDLQDFKDFSTGLDYDSVGLSINELTQVREAHNCFSPRDGFFSETETESDDKGADSFHFIAYVPYGGCVSCDG